MFDVVLFVPLLIQAGAMAADEFYFHYRRGLGRWERIGHPVDTLTVIATYLPTVVLPFSANNFLLFIALGLISCLVVTKDEWVHQQQCVAGEQWLHSLLFVMHPLAFVVTGMSWHLSDQPNSMLWSHLNWLSPSMLRIFLVTQLMAVCSAFIYQTIYWNYLWKPQAIK